MDRLVKEAYQRSTEQVRASHILIMLKADASPADTLAAWNKINDIRKRAVGGEDFGNLAKEFSEDPSAKTNGGDLNYFSAMDMVYPFESAAYQTKVGDISPVVKTRFGYHILKVTDRIPNGEVEVSHIMIRTGKGDDDKARNTIFEINDQLKAGRSWDELCKEFSEDPNTKNNGGRLRQFKRGAFATAAPEFEKTAFSLQNPGDISDPIQTTFGWHLVRLEKKIPVPPLKEIQGTLTRSIARDERLQLSKAKRIAQMKSRLNYSENPEVKNKALALADSSLLKAQWSFKNELVAGNICTVGSKKFGATDFLVYAKDHQTRNNQSPKGYLEQLYDKWTERILNLAEEEKLIQEKPEFKSILDEYREGILLFTIMEKEVWNKASNDSIGQQKFYQANVKRYQAGDRVRARIFSTDDKRILEEFKAKVATGDTLSTKDLRKLKSVSNFRAYEKGESKVTDEIPWAIGTHEIQLEGIFYLVDVEQLLPPGTKSFEEARAGVISDYQDQLEKEWLVTLKKKYPVAINTKGKKSVIQELTNKK
jgi:peptidyl-prolyl cis-trans isomerase SurA